MKNINFYRLKRIGLDLDNTVIDYKDAYLNISKIFELNFKVYSKHEIKSALVSSANGDYAWQEYQSQLYTKGLDFAKVSRGLLKFLNYCKKKKIEVFIISHKTESTPAEFGGLKLREPAMRWLQKNKIVPQLIKKDNIYFCSTQEEKIKMINSLKIDLFVDDLDEILFHDDLNKKIIRVLYAPKQKSNSICDFQELQNMLEH